MRMANPNRPERPELTPQSPCSQVNWLEDGLGWGPSASGTSTSVGTFLWRPDYYTYPSWYSDSNVNVTYAQPAAPTIELEDTSDVAAWMLCEMLTTSLTVSNDQVASGTCGYALRPGAVHPGTSPR